MPRDTCHDCRDLKDLQLSYLVNIWIIKKMRLYVVEKVSLFYSVERAQPFSKKFVTLLYFIGEGKIISRNYWHNDNIVKNLHRLPCYIELDEKCVAQITPGEPHQYQSPVRIFVYDKIKIEN